MKGHGDLSSILYVLLIIIAVIILFRLLEGRV